MRTVRASTMRQAQGVVSTRASAGVIPVTDSRDRQPFSQAGRQILEGVDGQVDQGFGIGLGRDVEAPTRFGGLSSAGEREEAQSREGRAQNNRRPHYGPSTPSWLRRLIATEQYASEGKGLDRCGGAEANNRGLVVVQTPDTERVGGIGQGDRLANRC